MLRYSVLGFIYRCLSVDGIRLFPCVVRYCGMDIGHGENRGVGYGQRCIPMLGVRCLFLRLVHCGSFPFLETPCGERFHPILS